MLLEQFPDLQALTAAEKLKLADELVELAIEATEGSVGDELRASLAAYRANPHDVVPWEVIKAGLPVRGAVKHG